MARLEGKTAIVTGAAGGIGVEIARLFANEGARLVLTDVRLERCQELAKDLCKAGAEIVLQGHDVTSDDDWKKVWDLAAARFGQVHILVNNAGIYRSGPISEMGIDSFMAQIHVNMLSVFLGTRHAIQAMKSISASEDSGSIVNMSSAVGVVGAPFAAAYSMTKGGVTVFTKSTALEVAKLGFNIRCNSVHPGVVSTPMGDQVVKRWRDAGNSPDQIEKLLLEAHPLGRLARPDEVAQAVLYLASRESSFATGSELMVDGGMTAR